MKNPNNHEEIADWVDALENLILFNGKEDSSDLMRQFVSYVQNRGLLDDNYLQLPFENLISQYEEEEYPGNWEIEEKIRHFIRWNALVTVLKANKNTDLGGHISTYSSVLTLYEVGFNHFFKGGDLADLIYFQGHSSRAFMQDLS